ncbi:TPM domain-containing protein [Methylopila henanensis]|uniref:TPM domain-containing protein n=1 Tax=Methylopila henanensis TaxID=873516 RepID=A0ABW4K8G1_9HYPH
MAVARVPGRLVAAVLIALGAVISTAAWAELSFPPFSGYVVDQADILPPEAEAALTQKLKTFQDTTGRQLAVATVPSLQGTSVEDFANRLFRAWGLGDKARNDGALLLVAPNDRRVRIEVGYGLEGELTDAVSRLIIENAILPRFRAGDFPGGVMRGADDVMAVFSGHSNDYKARAAALEREDETASLISSAITLCFILFFLYVFWRAIRSGGSGVGRRRRAAPWIIGGPPMGGGSWSGGSSSGGGFSGGGGGSSGGGGASGGW